MAENMAKEKAAVVGDREFTMERLLRAPRERVFRAFTEPEHLARWWAPNGYSIPVCRIDLRPGGIWFYCMRSPAGEEQWVKAVYREIAVPEKIVYTCTFADEHANPVDTIPEQLGTITFTEHDGMTKLGIRYQFLTPEDLHWTLDVGMVQGLTITLKQLEDVLDSMKD